eukprot:gene10892-12709_t
MTPNLVSDKPNIHAVQGNINSLAARNEVADIRKELKDIGSSLSTETKGMTKDSDSIPNRSILGVVDGSVPASMSTTKPESALPAATSCGVTCPDCAKLEDLSSVVRLASIYSKLALHQYLPLAKVLPVIQQLTSLDPDLCSKTSLPVCSNANPVLLPLAKDTLLFNGNCIRTFLRSLLGQLHPLLTSCGHLIANEIADAVSVRTWAPELSVKIKELLNNYASEHAAMVGLSSGSANFRLPETFQKPFREDLDSKNEFKTQLELATFYERERTYDELSNLFLRYQTTNRSDLDGSAIKMFFRTDLLKTGTTILTLKEPNYLWFAALFMRFLLYHGVQSTSAVSMLTTKPDAQASTEVSASTKTSSSTNNTVSLGSHVTSTPSAGAVSNVATTASAFSASPSRNTAFERALSAAASPIRKKQSCAPVSLSSTASNVPASASKSNLNTKFYSSNFPDLSATKKLTLDAAKQSKLEERLGMGGEAKTTLFSPSHTTVPPAAQVNAISTPHMVTSVTKKWDPTGAASRTTPDIAARITPSSSINSANNTTNNYNNNFNSNNSGPYKRNGPPARTSNSYSSSANSNANSPSVNHSAIDPYEVPAMHFEGTESFFFRFIVSMNNFRFNQGLLTCILVEIEELMRNDNSLDASFVNLNMESDSPTKSRKLSIFLPSDQNATKHHDGQNEVFIAPEDFALKVAKLKILGRFLGLLHFYHQWVPLGVSENGPLQKLASELAAKRNALQVSLPVLTMVQAAHREGKLSLALPWVVEFLKMLSWDPAVSAVSARARGVNVAHNWKGALENERQRIPYFDVLERLRSIQHSEKFKVSTGESNHSTSSGILSCNRVYCLMEIQNLWIALPHAVTSLVERCEVTPTIEPSPSMRPHLRSRDSPRNFSEASPVEFLSSVAHDIVGTLDDQNLAFSAAFLRHVVPFLEPVYLALKSSRLNGTASSSLRARALGAAKKIKRQTPSVITAESMALMEALTKPPPLPPTVDTVQSDPTVAPSLPRTEAIAVITATPTKAARSSSATSSTSASKSPRKKSSLDTSSGNISSMSIANMKSPVRRERSRNPSFESLSPPAHSFGLATGLSGGPHLGGTSRSNSITTSGRSSPAGGLFGSSRRQRSLSDLNHNPFSISRQHSMSPAPLKSFGTNTLSPLKLFEYNTSASESSDVLERLEISFWNDHPTLQTMNNFLLAHSYQACLEKLKELIGTAVRELIANLSSIKSERDNHKYEDLLETYSKRAHYELLAEGEQLVETFFTTFTEKTLPDMCKMYPANERVVKMAIFYMNRHLSARKAPLCAYLKSYSAKKLAELRELSIKQHHKLQGDAANSATPAADLAAVDNEKAAEDTAATQRTQCLAKMRVASAALVPYFTFPQDDTSSSADQVNVLELQCTCELSAQALLLAHSSGLALPVGAVMRNNVACVLALLQELTAQCSVYASSLLALRPTTDGSSSLHLTVRNNLPTSETHNLKTMLTKLTTLYQSCIVGIASVITYGSTTMSATAQAELAGKVGADFCKFVTSVLPHVLYLDLTLSVLSKPAAECAVTALTQHAMERNTVACSRNESSLTSLPSDLVHFLLSEKLMTLDMLSRAMALTARPKTAAYFENCKGLVGMQLCMNHGLLSLIGRILIRHQDTLGMDMSALEDDCWYKDSTIKLLVKSNLNEGLSNLISVLLVNL